MGWRLLLLLCVLQVGHDADSLRIKRNTLSATVQASHLTAPTEHSAPGEAAAPPSASPTAQQQPTQAHSPPATSSAAAAPAAVAALSVAPAAVAPSYTAVAPPASASVAAPPRAAAMAHIAQMNAKMQQAVEHALQEQNEMHIRQYKVAARVIGQLHELTATATGRVRELGDLVTLQGRLRQKAIADAKKKLEQAKAEFEKTAVKTMSKIRKEEGLPPGHPVPAHIIHAHVRRNARHAGRTRAANHESNEESSEESAGSGEQASPTLSSQAGQTSLAEIFDQALPRGSSDFERRIKVARRSFEKATATLKDLSSMEVDDAAGLMDHLKAIINEDS
jgi:hypothetical protein